MEFKAFPFECKVDIDKLEFEGYASTFGNRDEGGDKVFPGAFTKTLAERLPKNRIKVFWMHREPAGMPVRAEEDSKGLFTVSKFTDTPTNRERLALMKDGVVDALSIGYDAVKYQPANENGMRIGRDLLEIKLYEWSPVAMPMNEEALLTGIKSMGDLARVLAMLRFAGGLKSGGVPDLDLLQSLTEELKSGRFLSQADPAKREAAISALQALTGDGGEPDGESTRKPDTKGKEPPKQESIDPDTFQSIMATLKSQRGV